MPRIAYGRNKTQVDLSLYPDNGNYPIGTGEWNEDPEDGGLLGFTKQSATLSSNTFTPTATLVELTGETATDDIDSITITDTNEFDLIYLISASGQTLTLKHENNSGNSGEIVLLGTVDKAVSTTVPTILIRKGTKWYEYGGGITNAISDIGDVTLTSPTEHQILIYDGSNWYNNSPDKLIYVCKNAGSSTIDAGKIVYVSGFHTASSTIEIELADNSSASTMPAFGFTMESITAGSTGKVLQQGQLESLNTDGIAEGTTLYVGTSGNWSTTKPTGTALIQNIGKVLRDNVSSGIIHVGGSGRTNDVPNIADGKIWIGNSSAVATPVTPSGDATITNAGVISVSDLTISGETSQDLLYFNGSNWAKFAKGTAGQALKVNSGGTALEWGNVSSSLSTLNIDTSKSWNLYTISDLFLEPVNVTGNESGTVTTEVYAVGKINIGGNATLTVSGSGEVNLI